MRKAIIIILALVVALSALPVTFACYNGGWNNWHRFWRPHQPVYCCTDHCNVIFSWVSADDNELTFTEPKEVGKTTAYINYCTKNQLVITIDNAYPGYEGIVDFCLKNTGSLDATLTSIDINNPNTDYLQLDLNGEVQEGVTIHKCTSKCGQLVIYGIPQWEDAQNKTFTFTIDLNFECSCVPPGGGCNDGCWGGWGNWGNWGNWGGWGNCH